MSYKTSPEFLTATIIGVASSASVSSLCFGISYLNVPSLLISAPKASDRTRPQTKSGHLARQWQLVYDIGKITNPPISVVSAGSLIYAMTLIPMELKTQRQLYVTAAMFIVSIMPFTFVALAPTNTKLMKTAATEEKDEGTEDIHPGNVVAEEEGSTPELIRKWASLNAIRATLPILGIGCVVTALNW